MSTAALTHDTLEPMLRKRFTRTELRRLEDISLFVNQRLELIEGDLLEKNGPKTRPRLDRIPAALLLVTTRLTASPNRISLSFKLQTPHMPTAIPAETSSDWSLKLPTPQPPSTETLKRRSMHAPAYPNTGLWIFRAARSSYTGVRVMASGIALSASRNQTHFRPIRSLTQLPR
jgi:hypothetical protein